MLSSWWKCARRNCCKIFIALKILPRGVLSVMPCFRQQSSAVFSLILYATRLNHSFNMTLQQDGNSPPNVLVLQMTQS
jgi:hypothetical protein